MFGYPTVFSSLHTAKDASEWLKPFNCKTFDFKVLRPPKSSLQKISKFMSAISLYSDETRKLAKHWLAGNKPAKTKYKPSSPVHIFVSVMKVKLLLRCITYL